jgi:formylglycine-generating enzyme required for sulfatase activity
MGLPQTKKEKEQGVGGQVPVRITKGFWLAQTEFTQAQRTALKLENRGRVEPPGAKPDHPAWCNGYWIGAHDERSAVGTIAKLSAAVPLPAGWRFSLPTEAQWEYACRAGTETFFHFGDALDGTQANCNGEYPHGVATKGPNLGDVCPVASYPPNAWGLYDMHGNAAEWCLDFYAPTLEGGDDPTGPAAATNPERPERVTRGGGFGSRAVYCGSGARKNSHLGYHANGMGFRVAIVPGDAPPAAEQ